MRTIRIVSLEWLEDSLLSKSRKPLDTAKYEFEQRKITKSVRPRKKRKAPSQDDNGDESPIKEEDSRGRKSGILIEGHVEEDGAESRQHERNLTKPASPEVKRRRIAKTLKTKETINMQKTTQLTQEMKGQSRDEKIEISGMPVFCFLL